MAIIKVRKYESSIYVIYSHGNKKFKLFTGAKVDDKYWSNNVLKKSCPNYNILNSQIEAMQNQVLKATIAVRQKGLDPMPDLVRYECRLRREIKPDDIVPDDIWTKYDNFLKNLVCRESTKRRVQMSYNVMQFFCEWSRYDFNASTFNRLVLGNLIHYLLREQKLCDATVSKHIKSLKTFLKTAYPDKNWDWIKYTMLNVETEVIAMTEPELNDLIAADLTGYLCKARDLFVFMATTGIRHSDSQLFDPSWRTPEHVLEFTQLKTGGKAFPPLYDVASSILEKYDGEPPKISNQKFNDYLKVLFKDLGFDRRVVVQNVKGKQVFRSSKPLYEVISSHTARRTFISICLQKGMPIQDVMKMSGHSDFKSMKPYIRITRQHLRTVANKWEI